MLLEELFEDDHIYELAKPIWQRNGDKLLRSYQYSNDKLKEASLLKKC
jgi:hypothetical protein